MRAARDNIIVVDKHQVFAKSAKHCVRSNLRRIIINGADPVVAKVAINSVAAQRIDQNIAAIAATDQIVAHHARGVKAAVFIQNGSLVCAITKENFVITCAAGRHVITIVQE